MPGLKTSRNSRHCWIDLEGLESRTLLATIPAATATGAPVDLTSLSSVTTEATRTARRWRSTRTIPRKCSRSGVLTCRRLSRAHSNDGRR